MLSAILKPFVASVGIFAHSGAVRFACKTHRATYKRWRKIGGSEGYKRGIQGRKHGNAGFPKSVLKKRTGTAYANDFQQDKLRKLLPFM